MTSGLKERERRRVSAPRRRIADRLRPRLPAGRRVGADPRADEPTTTPANPTTSVAPVAELPV
jgi:hypothetical protein